MFIKRLIPYILLILFLLIPSLNFGQTVYEKYSKSPLNLGELQLIGKLLPRAIEEIISLRGEITALRKVKEIDDNTTEVLNLRIKGLEQLVEISKPRWWQQPAFIAIYIIIAFVGGIMVAL